ncbi:unnamed protein product [Closterium sp. NIES-53]
MRAALLSRVPLLPESSPCPARPCCPRAAPAPRAPAACEQPLPRAPLLPVSSPCPESPCCPRAAPALRAPSAREQLLPQRPPSAGRPAATIAAAAARATAAAAGGAGGAAGSTGGAAGAGGAGVKVILTHSDCPVMATIMAVAAARGGQHRSLPLPDDPTPQQLREWVIQRGSPGGEGFNFMWPQRPRDNASQRCVPGRVEAAALGSSESAAAPGAGESAAALGARESADAIGASVSTSTDPASPEALHTFTLDLGASRCFFRDCTTVTPLAAPVRVSLADPTRGPVVARASTVLPCPAVPSRSLSGLHLLVFSMKLLSNAVLQDEWVDTFIPGGQRVAICQVATSSRVCASGQLAASCSCRVLSHRTLLWHHRLGHPSLPRLRSMHSHLLACGLPRSLPSLPHSPASPCLPCVEGRQWAAHHSSEFPPTSAPLQTLHMDIWGLTPVGGTDQERYFLLVVDDYTRYTTVFPLRRKAVVSGVLIPWIRATRRQLRDRFCQDLPVLRLHSDRGGEFSSDLLAEFCRDEGIRQSFTLPTSPHKKIIAERRIGLIMELNLLPRVSEPETSPTLRWTGKVGDASVFRVLGALSLVHDAKSSKLSSRTLRCVFLGFPTDAPPWQFYHPRSCQVFSSRTSPLTSLSVSTGYIRTRPTRVLLPQCCNWGAATGGAGSGGAAIGGADSGSVASPSGGGAMGDPAGGSPSGGGYGPAGAGAASPGGTARGAGGAAGAGGTRDAAGARGAGATSPRGATGAGGAGPFSPGGTAGAGGAGGAGPGGARTRGVGAAGAGGAASAGGTTGAAGSGGAGGTAGDGGVGAGGTGGTGGAGAVGARGAGAAGAGGAGAGGTALCRLLFYPQPQSSLPSPDSVLRQVLSLPSSAGLTPPLLCPPTDQSQPQLLPGSPLPAPAPHTEVTESLSMRREPETRASKPVRARRVTRPRPPAVPCTHDMALRPSSVPQRVVLPEPPASSFPHVPDSESDLALATSPTVTHLLATVVTDCVLESTAAFSLVTELVDFAVRSRLDNIASLVTESESVSPPSVGGEPALSSDVLEDRQVKWPLGSPPAFKARYVARGFRQRQGVDFFQNFSPTSKMTSLWVLLHVAAQRDYELYSLDFSTTFLQGSLHEEIWLRCPPGFTGTTLAALGFIPSSADPSLFLRTDTTLPPFYVLVYVDELVFATADAEALALVKAELQEIHLCTDLGPSALWLPVLLARAHSSVYQPAPSQLHLRTSPSSRVVRTQGLWVASLHRAWGSCLENGVPWYSQDTATLLGPTTRQLSVHHRVTPSVLALELRWLTYLLTDLGELPSSPPVRYIDNKAMLALCREQRLEHIALCHFLARELQQRRQLGLSYVASQANTADVFTKALGSGDHQRFCTALGLVPTLPHLLVA